MVESKREWKQREGGSKERVKAKRGWKQRDDEGKERVEP